MKKIFILLLLVLGVNSLKAQFPIYDDARVYGNLVVDDSITTPRLVVDSIVFGDGTKLYSADLKGDSSWVRIDADSAFVAYVETGSTVIDSNKVLADSGFFDEAYVSTLSNNGVLFNISGGLKATTDISWNGASLNFASGRSITFKTFDATISSPSGGELSLDADSVTCTGMLKSDSLSIGGVELYADADTLKAPAFWAKFKGFIADVLNGDTIIIGNDTATGGIQLKAAIEAEQFAQLNFKDTTFTSTTEGQLFYDEGTKSLVFINDIADFRHNLGYELPKRVYNNSGATITNGSLVRRTGTYINGGRVPTIGLAGNGSADSARVCGMATVDIPDNSYGVVTIIGDVNFLNTTHLAEDQFYLGHAGATIDTSPPPPYYSVDLGCVVYSDNDSGIVAFHFRTPTFDPDPVISRYFNDSSITIDGTQNVYSYITNSTYDAYIENENKGFLTVGDSIKVLISGYYYTYFSASFQGTVSADTWKYGLFVDNTKRFTKTRYTASTNTGDITVPHVIYIDKDSWVSWRITSTTSDRDPVMIDASNSLIFLHE